ncbi:MAG: ATP-binding cassette domain-containing protein [Candidatus Pacebacteria bacterium]|nr:ATP-binding cassette domain-containing protein [Candidatus Paceibacterota bacterium]
MQLKRYLSRLKGGLLMSSSSQLRQTDSSQPALVVDQVSKLFNKQYQYTFKEFIPALIRGQKTHQNFWALKDISLTVEKGETVGIIGPNGSGKSTLLKLIAGVTEPTKGEIIVNGKIAPLIELGAGFHPELTGRENVYLNGVILGMSRQEIDQKFDEIVDFAELWDFIDQPVKHYSSGMYLRLAFAVAIHTEPEILLIDEILAVGDMKFQHKCMDKLRGFKKKDKTILLVTHDLNSVRSFCDSAVYLKNGDVKEKGFVNKVVDTFFFESTEKKEKNTIRQVKTIQKSDFNSENLEQKQEDNEKSGKNKQKQIEKKKKDIKITGVRFLDNKNKEKDLFTKDESLTIEISYHSRIKTEDVVFGIAFYRDNGDHLYGTNSLLQKKEIDVKPGKAKISFFMNDLPVIETVIQVTVAAHTKDLNNYDWHEKQYQFRVVSNKSEANGLIDFNAKFEQV